MAVSQSLVNDDTLQQTGDGADDLISGDQFFEGKTRENDIMYGGLGDDYFSAGRGTNSMYGEGGADSFVVGASGSDHDLASGGNGTDDFTLFNGPSAAGQVHDIQGGKGHDILYLGLPNVVLKNGVVSVAGTDIAHVSTVEQVIGTGVSDTLETGAGVFHLQGLRGEDVLSGADGQFNLLSGGSGNDSLTGGDKGDEIYDGDEGSDDPAVVPPAYDDTDTIRGGDGRDTLMAFSGKDEVYGNSGNDSIYSVAGNDLLKGGDGDDLFGFTFWTHWENADPLQKDDLARSQHELAGVNISGGNGTDLVTFEGIHVTDDGNTDLKKGVSVDLQNEAGSDMSRSAPGFGIVAVEDVTGTDRNDRLTGSQEDNRLDGALGNDTLTGANGNDTAIGGDGRDVFEFFASLLPGDKDTIKDFSLTDDLIRIQDNAALTIDDLTISNDGGNALVAYEDWSVLLKGVDSSDVTADHFEFLQI